MLNALILFLYI